MRKSLTLLGAVAVAAVLATSAFAANRGVTFTGIGFIQNPGSRPASSVWDVNADGTVFLVSPLSSGAYAAFWTREGGWGDLIGNVQGMYLSDSGSTVMGNGLYPGGNYAWPGYWTGAVDVWNPIPADPGFVPCGSSRLSMYDFAGEGDYVAGLTWQGCAIAQGFLYDKMSNTTIALGRPNGRSTRANAVTADGSKVTGWGTALFGTRRGATWQNGTWTFLSDPAGLEPKACNGGLGKGCTSNSADATYGCPGEYVDDGSCTNRGTCQNKGVCTSNVCVGGTRAGQSCTNSSQCPGQCGGGSNPGTTCTSDSVCAGTCTGPNAGATCTSNGACPDTQVCVANPNWTDDKFKGEAYDSTADGQYACGRNFDYNTKWNSGYRANPDGTFTELLPPETWPYLVDPFKMSDNGKVIVGNAGTRLDGTVPYMWIEGVGSIDLQLFLIAQGLDELYFWYLAQASTVNADGTIIGGYGFNPDGWMEGWIVDMHKIWVCHAPPGSPENARTLGIELGSAADHVAHGDFLGTCEFASSGALSRAVTKREALVKKNLSKLGQTQMDEKSSAWDAPAKVLVPKATPAKAGNKARPKNSARD